MTINEFMEQAEEALERAALKPDLKDHKHRLVYVVQHAPPCVTVMMVREVYVDDYGNLIVAGGRIGAKG